MLDFQINNSDFLTLFGAYVTFFAVLYGISKALNLLRYRSN